MPSVACLEELLTVYNSIVLSRLLCFLEPNTFSLAEGFDIVRKGGGTKANPAYRFSCYYHGNKTRNDRKLEDSVEYDEESRISSTRQRQNTTVRQLGCQCGSSPFLQVY